MSETAYYTRKNLIIAFIIGLIVGFGSYYVWDTAPFQSDKADEAVQEEVEVQKDQENDLVGDNLENPSTNIGDGNTITMNDQPAGMRVVLTSASFGTSVWVAVREDIGGEAGSILGAGRFDAGDYTNAEIELLRNTLEESEYLVVMYEDDGDREFDHKKDILITQLNGAPVTYGFSAIRIK